MDYYIVDVFSGIPFMGNPVAVVICDREMSATEMQQITAWFNLSETTFVPGFDVNEGRYKVRIFTPGGEIPFAGHPTLGTSAAIKEHFGFQGSTIKQDCLAGSIDIRFDQHSNSVYLIAPDQRVDTLSEAEKDQLKVALGLDEPIQTVAKIDVGPVWITALLSSSTIIENLEPNQELVKSLSDALEATGVVVGALHVDGKTYKVRTFAPSVGISEDPVCGSGNIAFASLRSHSGAARENYLAKQGQELGRDGEIQIAYLDEMKIELGGQTNITARGKIHTA